MRLLFAALLSFALLSPIQAQTEALRVIDGDSIVLGEERIRLATIDAPETRTAKCDAERRLGYVAARRLEQLLSGSTIEVVRGDPADGRLTDRFGRTLAVVYADGEDVATILVDEGLARPWTGRREPWCG